MNPAQNMLFIRSKYHWNGNVVILMKFSSLAALKVVKMTTSSAANDENFIKMMTFSFQWLSICHDISTVATYAKFVKLTPALLQAHNTGKPWQNWLVSICYRMVSFQMCAVRNSAAEFYVDQLHDDTIKWKHFPNYWTFVKWINRLPVDSPTKASDAELRCFLWSAPDQRVQ